LFLYTEPCTEFLSKFQNQTEIEEEGMLKNCNGEFLFLNKNVSFISGYRIWHYRRRRSGVFDRKSTGVGTGKNCPITAEKQRRDDVWGTDSNYQFQSIAQFEASKMKIHFAL